MFFALLSTWSHHRPPSPICLLRCGSDYFHNVWNCLEYYKNTRSCKIINIYNESQNEHLEREIIYYENKCFYWGFYMLLSSLGAFLSSTCKPILNICNIYFIATKIQSEITQWHCAFNSSHNKNPTRSLRKACLEIGPFFTIVFTRLLTNG